MAYIVRVYKVLGENPWRVERLEEQRYMKWDAARERFLEEKGFHCEDYASAWHQLCRRPVAWERVEVDGVELLAPVYEKLLLEPG